MTATDAARGTPEGRETRQVDDQYNPLARTDADSPAAQPRLASSGSWSSHRLILLANGGPRVVDLSLSVGMQSLESAGRGQMMRVVEQLLAPTANSPANDAEAASDSTPMQATGVSADSGSPTNNASESLSIEWSELLTHPLVRSGWLGNLVPEEGERTQLLAMYDLDADGWADSDELVAFLTRGLSRRAPFQFDTGSRRVYGDASSPWGIIDQDRDNLLSPDDITQMEATLMGLDANGDRHVSLDELDASSSMGALGSMADAGGQAFFEAATVLRMDRPEAVAGVLGHDQVEQSSTAAGQAIEPSDQSAAVERGVIPEEASEGDEISREAKRICLQLTRHYSFQATIPRDTWSAWSDSRWKMLDLNGDGQLEWRELDVLVNGPADVALWVRFPDASELSAARLQRPRASDAQATSSTQPIVDKTEDATSMKRVSQASSLTASQDVATEVPSAARFNRSMLSTVMSTGVQMECVISDVCQGSLYAEGISLHFENAALRIELQDHFTPAIRQRLGERLRMGFDDSQVRESLRQQLDLQPGAMAVADADDDNQLSDEELANVWLWLSSRQSSRLLGNWKNVSPEWFFMADHDGDRRLSFSEVREAVVYWRSVSERIGGSLSAGDLPLTAELVLRRSDGRLQTLGGPESEPVRSSTGIAWFDAMDADGDGGLTWEEFLGTHEDFAEYDRDRNGKISPSEVYDGL